MKIFNREFSLVKFFKLGLATIGASAKIIAEFKTPLKIILNYLRANRPLENTLVMRDGFRINLSSHPHDIITLFIIFGRNDYGKIEKGSIVIDIGANIGLFALYAAKQGAQKVYCFEPNLESYEILLSNIQENKLQPVVHPNRLAVSNLDDNIVHIQKNSSPYNAISHVVANEMEYDQVKTISLETFCKVNQLESIDLIKIDCEGAEFDIIPSMSEDLLRKVKRIKVEYQGDDVNKIIDHLMRHDFRIEYHLPDPRMDGGMLWMCSED